MTSLQEVYQLFLTSSGVQTDSRNIAPHQLFFALKGASFDGNSYAVDAIKKGACAAIVDDKEIAEKNEKCFWVDDVLDMLQKVAHLHRKQFFIPVVALTGSNGKTTTKELIQVVLGTTHRVLATKGNFNNHIGVPLTLLQLRKEHTHAIIEMGANHLGEIDFLCRIAAPTHGLITNVGKAHLEGFGSEEGVLKGKTELYRFLSQHQGTIFVNENDQKLTKAVEGKNTIYYSPEAFSVVEEEPCLSLLHKDKPIKTNLAGSYNRANIAAAICIGNSFHVPLKKSILAIEAYTPNNHRSQLIEQNNKTIVLDAYNANPTSMQAAMHAFSVRKGTKSVILGNMAELGEFEAIEHETLVKLATSLPFDSCYWVGNAYKPFVSSNWFPTTSDLKAHLSKNKIHADNLLVKGSRSVGLEQLLEVL